jgi:hypothetical protein
MLSTGIPGYHRRAWHPKPVSEGHFVLPLAGRDLGPRASAAGHIFILSHRVFSSLMFSNPRDELSSHVKKIRLLHRPVPRPG